MTYYGLTQGSLAEIERAQEAARQAQEAREDAAREQKFKEEMSHFRAEGVTPVGEPAMPEED